MKTNYPKILLTMTAAGIPITIQTLPSRVLSAKVNIVELVAYYRNKDIYSYGVSFVSKDIAHAKCVAEIVERIYVPNFEEGGVGVGFDKEKAQLSALYELIERDAFMPFFLLRNIPVRRIDNKIVKSILKKCEIGRLPANYTCIFFDITNDLGIPSIAAYVQEKKSGLMCVGIKSNINSEIALLGSLEEALLEMTLKEKYGKKMKVDTRDIFSMKRFKSIFIDNTNYQTGPLPNIQTSFSGLYAYLYKRGQSVVFMEKTPLIFKKLKYHVMVASSDTLQKVFFTTERININKKRLENIKRYYIIMEQNHEKNSISV